MEKLLDRMTRPYPLALDMSATDPPTRSGSAEPFSMDFPTPTSPTSSDTEFGFAIPSPAPFGVFPPPGLPAPIPHAEHERILNKQKMQFQQKMNDMRVYYETRIAKYEGVIATERNFREQVLATLCQVSNANSSQQATFMKNGIPIPLQDVPVTKFDPTMHASVAFWTEAEWGPYRQGHNMFDQSHHPVTRVPVYLHNLDGDIMSRARWQELNQDVRNIFNTLCRADMTPGVWGNIDQLARRYLQHALYVKFPELSYCEGHWKFYHFMKRAFADWNPALDAMGPAAAALAGQLDPKANSLLRATKKREHSQSCLPSVPAKKRKRGGPELVLMTIASPTPGSSTLAQQDEDVAMATSPTPSSSAGALGNAAGMDVATASNEARVSFELPSTSVAIGSSDTSTLAQQGHSSEVSPDSEILSTLPRPSSTLAQQGDQSELSPNNAPPSFELPSSSPPPPAAEAVAFTAVDPLASFYTGAPPAIENPHKDTSTAPPKRVSLPAENANDQDNSKKMRPVKKTATARNMYALAYVKKNPNTTSAEFDAIWKALVAANNDIVKEYNTMVHFAHKNTEIVACDIEGVFYTLSKEEHQPYYMKEITARKGKKKAT